ncbi:hypothetical protein EPD60_09860 [Flaviaesturariibacter flavus]|uniref:Two-component sensor histidine kinase n=1 Tax=Flaviaesturariibacter flavus TaxID=2502780 RepID=A0A4R1BBC0_9BACT|nr:hypothetical protein [Flaviaesturariibacter flavus]TCJ14296.1 hypothetical protein EPD60_09860 [Flaviaesturariibacter flavus]
MKRNLSLVLVSAFLIISIVHLLVFAVVQQVHRQAANEGPRLLAGRLSVLAASGRLGTDTLDAETRSIIVSRGLFYLLADADGLIRATNLPGYDGPVRRLPVGLLGQARGRGSYAITWAPQGVRYALVLCRAGNTGTYVGGCQPLLYSESNVLKLWEMVLLSWIGCSVSLAFAGAVLFRRFGVLVAAQRNVLAA